MLHVSFAMTSDAFADRSKTETRRFWKPSHAAKFKPGTVFMGTTKDFRAGGTRIHPARVVFVRQERLGDMTEESFQREGGTRYWPSREDYIFAMGGSNLVPFVIRFEHLHPESTKLYRFDFRSSVKTGGRARGLPSPSTDRTHAATSKTGHPPAGCRNGPRE